MAICRKSAIPGWANKGVYLPLNELQSKTAEQVRNGCGTGTERVRDRYGLDMPPKCFRYAWGMRGIYVGRQVTILQIRRRHGAGTERV